MAKLELLTMSMRELDTLKTIQAVADGNLRAATAAARLRLSRRQVDRLTERFRVHSALGLLSRKRGQVHHCLEPELAAPALAIICERYPDFGPTLDCEKLRERHGIVLGKETVRKLMRDAGLRIPRKLRSPTVYLPRNRRHCVGELIQIDGSDHRWFEDRAPACTLLVFIDDATSRLMQLHFTYSESTFSYFDALRAYLERHGKPQAFYSDKAGIFRVNQKQTAGGKGYTQVGRALYGLNIETLCANTSQAKGRVERANLTLQDRLVKELRLQGTSTMAAANAYAPTLLADYNRRFAKPPRNDFDAHRPVRDDEDLDLIFTWRETRKVSHALTLQYDKTLYLLANTPAMRKLIHRYRRRWIRGQSWTTSAWRMCCGRPSSCSSIGIIGAGVPTRRRGPIKARRWRAGRRGRGPSRSDRSMKTTRRERCTRQCIEERMAEIRFLQTTALAHHPLPSCVLFRGAAAS